MLKSKKLFEIQVYRTKENDYYNEMRSYIEKINSDNSNPLISEHLRKEYGGDWKYNEIIGFLQFYQYGENQIRCEYWDTEATRKVRTRRKTFVQVSNSYCNEMFSKSESNLALAQLMKNAVEHCENRLKNKNWTLDRELFDNTVDFIDWKSLLN
ncbi:hypothetical protein [Polaromonas naphthalenivorans]|uniref:Uncharacterized protein n=1 Tax=Polaromonas naphthalenivorans (strain CJ2) TaxID=365044 RepID=A1VJW7_POLNA|nr:hypothetical protein [Polaromonas naphthalenivorans]ABM35945.1 hypothetical protein Pnap_0626 [Polaromonas naphthalenivorans CJ2]ABM39654.1 hypothetical protein Pnap_4376 [Polaromonas naphthalenivorans CJ2]